MTTKQKLIAHLASLPVHQTSAGRLAKALGVSYASVALQLQWLVAAGHLEVVERKLGPGGGTIYAYRHGFDGEAHPEHALAIAVRQ